MLIVQEILLCELHRYTWYGVVMLVVECFGATTIMNYGINLLWDPVYTQIQDDPRKPGCSKVSFLDRKIYMVVILKFFYF